MRDVGCFDVEFVGEAHVGVAVNARDHARDFPSVGGGRDDFVPDIEFCLCHFNRVCHGLPPLGLLKSGGGEIGDRLNCEPENSPPTGCYAVYSVTPCVGCDWILLHHVTNVNLKKIQNVTKIKNKVFLRGCGVYFFCYHSKMIRFVLFTIVFLLSFDVSAEAKKAQAEQSLTVAAIIDGDTLEVHGGSHIRLWGVDTPERGEYGYWSAGQVLEHLLGKGAKIKCTQKGVDKYQRLVMQCFFGDDDLGAVLVHAGWAVDYPQFSKGFYAAQEQQAKKKRRGLWED